jgi:hypothetical protein
VDTEKFFERWKGFIPEDQWPEFQENIFQVYSFGSDDGYQDGRNDTFEYFSD